MADTKHRDIPFEELVTEQPESTDPAYLDWKRKKVEATLKHLEEHPEDVLSEEDVWRKHGLDYINIRQQPIAISTQSKTS